ncbi:hypothetical protein J437_LFUL013828 [Ladona fulva]|uniref:28S ribosomal protein S9, mitochondrial n=1 Tax=Ladona fulva TaxID=123851 RepID=A0A8K0K2B1_LADFU|nr:hypothetical protein J437_LFUL013828 [Ladona fulva]
MAATATFGLLRRVTLKQTKYKLFYALNNAPTDMKLRYVHSVFCKSTFCTEASGKEIERDKSTKSTISKAMRLYLERSREYEEFMRKESINYKIGRRHLANMMGEDPETFTQEDIDRAIEYLFPSGLFEPRARPLMRPPEEVFPQRKEAEFDESGRPYHFLFYTGKPNYYQLLHDVVTHLNGLNKYEDEMIRRHSYPGEADVVDFSGSEWISKDNLETLLVETINEREYDNFVKVMERLSHHPYAFRIRDFISKYRKLLISQTKASDIPKPLLGEDGKSRITVTEAQRKTARASATITHPGTGKITINGADILYFERIQSREQLI